MSTIWVGEIAGKALVYDPAIQLPDCPHLFLWRPSGGEMGKYIADITRKLIRPYANHAQASEYIAAYQAWRNSYGEAWIAGEKLYYESRKAPEANPTPAERHKERLKKQRMVLHPQGINGPWKTGIVLDWHTVASQVIGQNEFGHPIFDNERSEIGELLYQFKYRSDQKALQQIVRATIEYLGDRVKGRIDVILPVPPSNPTRTVTSQIAEGLADELHVGFSRTALMKSKSTNELKSVTDPEERRRLLEGVFTADKQQLEGKSILLVDDVYRSGATLSAATEVVAGQGKAKVVYVLAITRTRVHK